MLKNSEKMYHIGLCKEDIKGAKYAILPGDPQRVQKIAELMDSCVPLTVSREYTSYLGTIENEPVLVISTGMGGPSAAICIEELKQIGIENVIRVGTCGGMQPNVKAGDLVIAEAAIRQDGTTKEYVPIEYPAVADFEMLCTLKNASDILGMTSHVGIVQSKDSFYGQHDPLRMPISYELNDKWNAWIKAGCLSSEMETATVYVVSKILNIKAVSILLVVWNQELEKAGVSQDQNFDTEGEIRVAIQAIRSIFKSNNIFD